MKKYLIFILFLTSCSEDRPSPVSPKNLPSGISKFKDGEVTCYIIKGPSDSISCLVLPEHEFHFNE